MLYCYCSDETFASFVSVSWLLDAFFFNMISVDQQRTVLYNVFWCYVDLYDDPMRLSKDNSVSMFYWWQLCNFTDDTSSRQRLQSTTCNFAFPLDNCQLHTFTSSLAIWFVFHTCILLALHGYNRYHNVPFRGRGGRGTPWKMLCPCSPFLWFLVDTSLIQPSQSSLLHCKLNFKDACKYWK